MPLHLRLWHNAKCRCIGQCPVSRAPGGPGLTTAVEDHAPAGGRPGRPQSHPGLGLTMPESFLLLSTSWAGRLPHLLPPESGPLQRTGACPLSAQQETSLSILSMSPIPSKADWYQHDWHVSFPNRWTDSLVDTIFNIFTFLAWPVVPSIVKFLGPGLLCFWHRLDQQRERLAEA